MAIKETMNKETKTAQADVQGLIQMYQAGFLDGYKLRAKAHIPDKNLMKKISVFCIKSFELRFVKRMQKRMNGHVKFGKTGRNGNDKEKEI